MSDWRRLPSEDSSLFEELRALGPVLVRVRFHLGTENPLRTEIPASSFTLQGRLFVKEGVDRFGIDVPGWGPTDFAWFARRRSRGGPDYWQGAVEYHHEGAPALVYYFTAPLDGLDISVNAP